MKSDHNMWTYIYYSIYLDTKDTSDHNALEKFVYEMVHDPWFLQLSSLCGLLADK